MTYRNDVDALAARHAALELEVIETTKHRNTASQLLEEAKARARLPILDNVRVATPCTADWNQMTGDERVRACGACNKNVYNLSSMTRDDAEALIIAKEGKLCVRYFQRSDGTMLLADDCAVGKRQKRKRRVIAAGAAALLAGSGVMAWKLTRHDTANEARRGHTVGVLDMPISELRAPPPPQSVSHPDMHEVKGGISIEPEQLPPPKLKLKVSKIKRSSRP